MTPKAVCWDTVLKMVSAPHHSPPHKPELRLPATVPASRHVEGVGGIGAEGEIEIYKRSITTKAKAEEEDDALHSWPILAQA